MEILGQDTLMKTEENQILDNESYFEDSDSNVTLEKKKEKERKNLKLLYIMEMKYQLRHTKKLEKKKKLTLDFKCYIKQSYRNREL